MKLLSALKFTPGEGQNRHRTQPWNTLGQDFYNKLPALNASPSATGARRTGRAPRWESQSRHTTA